MKLLTAIHLLVSPFLSPCYATNSDSLILGTIQWLWRLQGVVLIGRTLCRGQDHYKMRLTDWVVRTINLKYVNLVLKILHTDLNISSLVHVFVNIKCGYYSDCYYGNAMVTLVCFKPVENETWQDGIASGNTITDSDTARRWSPIIIVTKLDVRRASNISCSSAGILCW